MITGVNQGTKSVFLSEDNPQENPRRLAALKAWSPGENVGTPSAFKQLCRFNAPPSTLRAATVDGAVGAFAGSALLYFVKDKVSCVLFSNFLQDPSALLECLGENSGDSTGAALYRTAFLTCSATLLALGGYWIGRRLFTDTCQQSRYDLLQKAYANAMQALDQMDNPEKKETAGRILKNLPLIETLLQDRYRMTPLQAQKLCTILRTGCEAV